MPDHPLTKELLDACFQLLDAKWEVFEGDHVGRKNTALLACMLISGYYGALRGEEVNRVELGGINKYWDEAISRSDDKKHVPLVLGGTFKRETGMKFFTQPLAYTTKSGRCLGEWFERIRKLYKEEGVVTGPLFRNETKVRRASIAEMDVPLHALLREVQRKFPNLIPDNVRIEDSYSMYRSTRRGATSEALNQKIPKEVIEANNRWRKYARANGLTPGMSMMERYSDAKASVPTLIRFSFNLG